MKNTRDKEIKQAHQEWMDALDKMDDAIFIHDKDFRILRCNMAYRKYAGLPYKDIIGRPYFEVFPKSDAPLQTSIETLNKSLVEESQEEIQVGDILFRSHAYAMKDSMGAYLYSLHTLEDITEHKKIEKALQASEKQFRRLFEAAQDGILLLDADTGLIVDANPFITNLLHYDLEEFIGKRLWELGFFRDKEDSKAAFEELQENGYIRYRDLPLKTKDGRQIDVEFVSNLYDVGERKMIQCNIRDISEHKRIVNVLKASEKQFRRLFEAAQDGILLLDSDTGLIVDANPFILHLLHYDLEDFVGKRLWELGFFRDKEDSKTAFEELQKNGYIRYSDLPLKTKDGRQIDVEFVSNLYDVGERKVIQCNIRDIRESLHAKEILNASYDLIKSIVENIPVRVFWKDSDLNFLGCNTLVARDAGMTTPEELIGKDDFQMAWHEQAEIYRADDREIMDTGIPKIGYEELQTTPDGTRSWISTSKVPLRAKDGSIFGILGIYDDITQEKTAEEKLKLFRTLIDHSSDAIEVLEPSTLRFLDVNITECTLLGYSREEMLSMSAFDIDPTFTPEASKKVEEEIVKEGHVHFETIHKRRDGSTFPVEVSATLIEVDKPYILSIARDITQRKKDEESLRRSNRALKTLSAGNLALIHAKNEDGLLQEITRIIVENGQYSLAVVDYAKDDMEKSIIPVAWSGLEKREYWVENLSWADTQEGELPVAIAIRTGKTQICHDIAKDQSFKQWREGALAHGYLSNISLPLFEYERVFGALCIYSSTTNSFDKDEVKLLEELASDLSYGIVTLRARTLHEGRAVLLQESLEQSIQAIASTVESRDPYTAGHQRRVSELATAIAQEMKLPQEQVQGIRFAALIHDLGKIHTPAEILSKPGKLNHLEYQLIQMHPQSGYEILKDVRFPWPIAQIILQHHEKLDGSGYPQGLTGDDILLEARIITVADVVEAISSHRPYRPALGMAFALEEIKRGKGSEYDVAVVDACIRVLNEKGFEFNIEAL